MRQKEMNEYKNITNKRLASLGVVYIRGSRICPRDSGESIRSFNSNRILGSNGLPISSKGREEVKKWEKRRRFINQEANKMFNSIKAHPITTSFVSIMLVAGAIWQSIS